MRLQKSLMSLMVLALAVPAAWAGEPDLKALFGQLLPGMSQEQAQQKWQDACWKAAAPGHEAERALACTLMTEKLGPETPAPVRVWLLKQLERIGRGESVAAIAQIIHDQDPLVRDAATRALANNPAPSAGDRLREALAAAPDRAGVVALLNALGFRARRRASIFWQRPSRPAIRQWWPPRRGRWARSTYPMSPRNCWMGSRPRRAIPGCKLAMHSSSGARRCSPRENWTRQEGPRVLCTLQTSRRGSAGWNCV